MPSSPVVQSLFEMWKILFEFNPFVITRAQFTLASYVSLNSTDSKVIPAKDISKRTAASARTNGNAAPWQQLLRRCSRGLEPDLIWQVAVEKEPVRPDLRQEAISVCHLLTHKPAKPTL